MDLDPTSRKERGAHEGGGRALLGHAPCLVGPSWLPSRTSCTHIYLRDLKLPERIIGREFRPPEASVATKSQSGPCSSTLPEGGTLTDGHLHHPGALHDEEGVVLPRG